MMHQYIFPRWIFAILMLLHVLTEAVVAPFFVVLLSLNIEWIWGSEWKVALVLWYVGISTVLILSQFSMMPLLYTEARNGKNLLKYAVRFAEPFVVAVVTVLFEGISFLYALAVVLSLSYAVRIGGHAYAAWSANFHKKERLFDFMKKLFNATFQLLFLFGGAVLGVVVAVYTYWAESTSVLGILCGVIYLVHRVARYGNELILN